MTPGRASQWTLEGSRGRPQAPDGLHFGLEELDESWRDARYGVTVDSKMTMDVYAQLEQRVDRTHGTNFDQLITTARNHLAAHKSNEPEEVPVFAGAGSDGARPPSCGT